MKRRASIYLTFFPLALIVGGLVYTTIRTLTSDTALTQRHWIAYGLTSVILLTHFIRTKISNVILGTTLILGLLNVITFTPTTMTIGGGLIFLNTEMMIGIQLFSLIALTAFLYTHWQPVRNGFKSIIGWFNKDGL